ncbi:hypothetical protein KFZ58_12220 [Virgibacillus sp. NKC19-16]|uniref:hypothetical protein n=1 Tax=Virgibacillus salidurans TaxID=2831673 RepID=UPI001F3CBAA3|nr:hypothetical protein [Virgibacillus sp. NKC19-16]UJL45176.1 hypothetical protein KFZ58_12220 [Virgibacillus sp. NKC19-16]
MRLLKKIATKVILTSAALYMAVLLLPIFLITEQVDEFSKLIEAIFKDREE